MGGSEEKAWPRSSWEQARSPGSLRHSCPFTASVFQTWADLGVVSCPSSQWGDG